MIRIKLQSAYIKLQLIEHPLSRIIGNYGDSTLAAKCINIVSERRKFVSLISSDFMKKRKGGKAKENYSSRNI